MDLSQAKHAFVTGGASGIGLGIADALAARGLAVTIADIDPSALETAAAGRGDKVRGVVLDVRDRAAWARAKGEAEAAFGPVDLLVNNAGIGPDGRSFADMDPESFERIMAINLFGVFNGVNAFAADMRARGQGHIVNTSSMAGLYATAPGGGGYSVSKFGVTAMSEAMRQELAPHGVGVSVVCPGFVRTNILTNTLKISGNEDEYDITVPEDAMRPAEAGEIVVAGIEANLPYIATHPESLVTVEARMDDIRASFQAQAPTPVRA